MLYDAYEMMVGIKAMDENENLTPVDEADAYDPTLDSVIASTIDYYDEVAEIAITTK